MTPQNGTPHSYKCSKRGCQARVGKRGQKCPTHKLKYHNSISRQSRRATAVLAERTIPTPNNLITNKTLCEAVYVCTATFLARVAKRLGVASAILLTRQDYAHWFQYASRCADRYWRLWVAPELMAQERTP